MQLRNLNQSFGKKQCQSLKNNMTTAKEALILLEAHEKQCAIRYQHIEKKIRRRFC